MALRQRILFARVRIDIAMNTQYSFGAEQKKRTFPPRLRLTPLPRIRKCPDCTLEKTVGVQFPKNLFRHAVYITAHRIVWIYALRYVSLAGGADEQASANTPIATHGTASDNAVSGTSGRAGELPRLNQSTGSASDSSIA